MSVPHHTFLPLINVVCILFWDILAFLSHLTLGAANAMVMTIMMLVARVAGKGNEDEHRQTGEEFVDLQRRDYEEKNNIRKPVLAVTLSLVPRSRSTIVLPKGFTLQNQITRCIP